MFEKQAREKAPFPREIHPCVSPGWGPNATPISRLPCLQGARLSFSCGCRGVFLADPYWEGTIKPCGSLQVQDFTQLAWLFPLNLTPPDAPLPTPSLASLTWETEI